MGTTAIAEAWARLDHKFDLMYAERAWRRESSPRPGRIWLLWKKITRKLEWNRSKAMRLETNTRMSLPNIYFILFLNYPIFSKFYLLYFHHISTKHNNIENQ